MNKNLLLVAVAAVALLGGLYFVFKPAPPPPAESAAPAPGQQPPAGVALRQEFMLMVEGGKLVAGPESITVMQGTEVTVIVSADKADEVHLHGYDRSVKLVAREPTPLKFLADRAGRFELELHGAHAGIAVIEVQPQ